MRCSCYASYCIIILHFLLSAWRLFLILRRIKQVRFSLLFHSVPDASALTPRVCMFNTDCEPIPGGAGNNGHVYDRSRHYCSIKIDSASYEQFQAIDNMQYPFGGSILTRFDIRTKQHHRRIVLQYAHDCHMQKE